jgi:hypothetical protein
MNDVVETQKFLSSPDGGRTAEKWPFFVSDGAEKSGFGVCFRFSRVCPLPLFMTDYSKQTRHFFRLPCMHACIRVVLTFMALHRMQSINIHLHRHNHSTYQGMYVFVANHEWLSCAQSQILSLIFSFHIFRQSCSKKSHRLRHHHNTVHASQCPPCPPSNHPVGSFVP